MDFFSDYQRYIASSRYARYLPTKQRRETWEETVGRYCDYFKEKYGETFPYEKIFQGIYNLQSMPSMRALMTAGKALERDHAAGYNCAYIACDNPRAFDETIYLLMCGCGVGFSVERQVIQTLPEVSEQFNHTDSVINVRDSKIGWATGLRELVAMLFSGQIPKWDLSALRPAGAPLKTFGGRSSGPEPLNELFTHLVRIFRNAAGRQLTSIECHDIMNHIAATVVVGGVRRSAQISLSNLSDDRMRKAKQGQWWIENSQRGLANNSVAYTEKPDIGTFMNEWKSLYESRSGERGIFNRYAALKKIAGNPRRDEKKAEQMWLGANPCCEIFLRSCGFCNLTEVVIRPEDTLEDILRKIENASIMGTFQSSLVNFRYLRAIWKKNATEEHLLGVSLTGIMDHPVLSGVSDEAKEWLDKMREFAVSVNKEWAEKIDIPQSAAVTTVKPSGTVSQLVDAASGIHPRFSEYYLRTVRSDKADPIGMFLKSQGIHCEDDFSKPGKTWVFTFPQKSPKHAKLVTDMTAIDQLEHYLQFYKHWSEHTVSITVYVREHEWLDVGAWVFKHFDEVGGISFLPHTNHTYQQAPYTAITEDEYNEWMVKTPKINWDEFIVNEHEDLTEGSQQLACVGGACEMI